MRDCRAIFESVESTLIREGTRYLPEALAGRQGAHAGGTREVLQQGVKGALGERSEHH